MDRRLNQPSPAVDLGLDRLHRAVCDAGINPLHHSTVAKRTRAQWPMLFGAIDALLELRSLRTLKGDLTEELSRRAHDTAWPGNADILLDPRLRVDQIQDIVGQVMVARERVRELHPVDPTVAVCPVRWLHPRYQSGAAPLPECELFGMGIIWADVEQPLVCHPS